MAREEVKTLEQEPCKDAVSREKVWYMITGGKYSNEDYEQFIDRLVNELKELPSVTPQEPMVEIDLYSVIKQSYIEREVLDKIRAEINKLTVYYTTKDKGINLISQKAVNRIFDKYKAESEGK